VPRLLNGLPHVLSRLLNEDRRCFTARAEKEVSLSPCQKFPVPIGDLPMLGVVRPLSAVRPRLTARAHIHAVRMLLVESNM
jgi:hypothetical protein